MTVIFNDTEFGLALDSGEFVPAAELNRRISDAVNQPDTRTAMTHLPDHRLIANGRTHSSVWDAGRYASAIERPRRGLFSRLAWPLACFAAFAAVGILLAFRG